MNRIKYNFSLLIILIIFLVNFCIAIDSKTPEFITELSDSDYEIFIKSEFPKKFLIFYLDTCSHCKRAMNTLEQVRANKNNDLSEVNFGAINCNEHKYTCMAFKIKHVPYMVLIQENKYKEFKSYPVPEEIYKFIDNGVEEEGSMTIPEPQTVFRMFFGIVNEISDALTEGIQEYLDQNGINIKWQNSYTILLFIVGIICLIIIEIIILNYCFSRGTKINENTKKSNENTNKESNIVDNNVENNESNKTENDKINKNSVVEEEKKDKSELEKKNQ